MTTGTRVIPDEMVRIPAGRCRMGSDGGYAEEAPAHEVAVAAFALDRHPVTNRQFKAFCDATGRPYPTSPRWENLPHSFLAHPDHPVVNVGYEDATAYAAWAGKRLPTEAEWEYAARGGLDDAPYPWGAGEPGSNRAQYATRESAYPWRKWRHSTGERYTAPVGSFPPNGYGLHDMAGNVWEWCAGWFYRYPDEEIDLSRVREGWGLTRVLRGGAFYSPPWDLRVSRRLRVFGGVGGNGMGFRCAMNLHPAPSTQHSAPSTSLPPEIPDTINLRMTKGVELCLGVSSALTDDEARRIRQLGFTSVEQYVTWETVENGGEGAFDFSAWDEQVALLKRHGLKWVPFLIAGPAYSLPDWYRRSDEFRGLVCLEHGLESRIQSIWDTRFVRHLNRFLGAFAARYRDAGVIESLLLGITGDFGEAIFPVTGTTWTTIIPGPYHTHGGYWCGDRFARADFRQQMMDRFNGNLDSLNERWGTTFRDPAEIAFPPLQVDPVEGFRVDEPTDPGVFPIRSVQDRRRWLDFIDWYRDSMNRLARTWIETTRRHVPDHPIYLCTGGSAPPQHGAHFGAQCKLAADYGAGVRITNEASNYGHNFAVTHWVASAGRVYGAYFGFEPAGGVDERGVTARIDNALVSGARNLHFYRANIFERQTTVDAWLANYEKIAIGEPAETVAILYPDTSIVTGDIELSEVTGRIAQLRDALNVDFVDDGMIADGALSSSRVLIIFAGAHFLRETIESVRAWVEAGGLLAAFGTDAIRSVEDEDLTGRLFAARERTGDNTLWLGNVSVADAVPDLTAWLTEHDAPPLDGVIDNVYAARLAGSIVLLHHGHETIEKTIMMPDGSTRSVTLPPNAIVELALM